MPTLLEIALGPDHTGASLIASVRPTVDPVIGPHTRKRVERIRSKLQLFLGCLAPVLLVWLALAVSLAAAGQEKNEDDKKPLDDTFQEFSHPLRGNLLAVPGFDLFGPEADGCVQFEPAGMRLMMAPGKAGGRANSGLSIPMVVKGDFEITVSFEILQEPEPADGAGTRFSLGIYKDSPRTCVATISRSVGPKQGPLFVSWWQLWTTEAVQPPPKSFVSPTKIKAGRLRLARTGSALSFLVADGEKNFNLIKKNDQFGDENLRLLRLSAATGNEKATLDVRVTDLHVRAKTRPVVQAPDGVNNPNPDRASPDGNAPESRPRTRLLTAALIAAFLTFAFAATIGVWLFRRYRRRAMLPSPESPVKDAPEATAAAPLISFACSDCGKKLRVKAELAGKKVKCPQCGKALQVEGAQYP